MSLDMQSLVTFAKRLLFVFGLLLFPLQSIFATDAVIEKIQWHLDRVEGILRQVDTSTVTEDQKANRTKMLDRLHSYTEAGQFPNNDKFPGESVPFFRGSNGNLCAVGYLMDADPEYQPFIETIVQTNNTVRIMDVQDNPTLNSWAKKYGFSLLELAMIQPTYQQKIVGPVSTLSEALFRIGVQVCFLVAAAFGIFLLILGVSFILRKNYILGKKYLFYSLVCIVISILVILAGNILESLLLS